MRRYFITLLMCLLTYPMGSVIGVGDDQQPIKKEKSVQAKDSLYEGKYKKYKQEEIDIVPGVEKVDLGPLIEANKKLDNLTRAVENIAGDVLKQKDSIK